MNILAAAVVHIIGLAVLRNEPQMGGMHVVLPSVAKASHVERHSAILVFRDDTRVDDGNTWPSFPLKPMPGHSYVKLDGERVRFIVNGANAPTKIPAGLPHLRNSCTLMSELREGYQPPAYAEASAVVMIPTGSASACRTEKGRIDTTVRMVNKGNYQIVACNKSITLKNNAAVMIVHLPTAWVEGTESKPSDLHSDVYFHMAPMTADARKKCALPLSSGIPDCASYKPPIVRPNPVHLHVAAIANPAPPAGETFIIPSTTFECSNTQWP